MQTNPRTLRVAQGLSLALFAGLVSAEGPSLAAALGLGVLLLALQRLEAMRLRLVWQEALGVTQDLIECEAPPDEVRASCEAALALAPPGSVDHLLTELELSRCLVLEGDTSRPLEGRLRGQLEAARQRLGAEDVRTGLASQTLGLFLWLRARLAVERDGVVDFHDPDLLRRVGENMLGYFYPDEDEDETLDADLEPGETRAARLAAISFHWRDLYEAEAYLGEALAVFRAAEGEDDVRTALAKAVLAQVLAVNRSPDMALQLAGEAVATLTALEGEDHRVLSPAYEALGLAYHMKGRTAESAIYLQRSERLGNVVVEPGPLIPARPGALPRMQAEGGPAEYRVHVPEDADPIIH